MNNRKILTNTRVALFKTLYKLNAKIERAGKPVFDNTVIKDEYNITKVVGIMRAAAHTIVRPTV